MSEHQDHVEKKGLTRRAFLGHAAVAGGAAAIGSSILGVPQALAAGSDWSQVDAENIVWDRETDVIFVGTGYAALCAAIEAYDAGTTDFLIIDKAKANAIGGNSILCAGSAQFAGTDVEAAQAASPPAGYPDTPNDTVAWMIADSLKWGDYRANVDVLTSVTRDCPDTVKWLRDHLGLKFKKATTFQYGMRETVARTHQPDVCGLDATDPNWYPGSSGISYWYVMYNYLKKAGYTLGDKLLTEHKAVRFIQAGEDGPVVGLEVQDLAAGKTLNIRTRKGVVLGSGGWKSNANMRTNWDPRLGTDFGAGGLPYVETTGEMIMAANDIGADLTGMDYVCEFRVKWGTKKYQNWDNDITHPTTGAGLTVPSNYDKAMCVDINGKRFIDEYTSNTIDAQDFCEAFACMPAPRAVWAVMEDGNAPAAWKTAYTNAQAATDQELLHATTPCVWKDMIVKADTLEGLADAMQLSATAKTAFVAEVAKYNGYVDAKVDSDFARPAAHMTGKIATGPFYAVKAQFFAHDQMSGVTVNTRAQVVKRSAHIDPDDVRPIDQQDTIDRLYAAGECCGGYYGNERGHGKIGIVMNAGRIAGKQVVLEEKLGATATALAIAASAATTRVGRTVKLAGELSGVEGVPVGAQVHLQVRAPGKTAYKTIATPLTMGAARKVATAYKLTKAGNYYFRMQFVGTASFAPCTSKSVKVVAR